MALCRILSYFREQFVNVKIAFRTLLVLLCFSSMLRAQNSRFQVYSFEQGLPSSTIYNIAQDKRGYLWLATEGGGLCRFDGTTFKVFGKKEGFTATTTRCVFHDSKDRIWAGTKDEGLFVYDGFKFSRLTKAQGLAGSTILCLLEDKNGNIWAGSDDGGINRISALGIKTKNGSDSFKIEVIDQSKGLGNNSVFSMCADEKGRIWLATYEGLSIVNEENGQVTARAVKGSVPGGVILSVEKDEKGVLWFGSLDAGIFCIEPDQDPNSVSIKRPGIFVDKTWDICRSGTGSLWFATYSDAVIRKSGEAYKSYTVKDGLPVNMTLCIFEDSEKNVWIGTNGGGLCKYTGDVFTHYSDKNLLPGNLVNRITEEPSGKLWLAMAGTGLVRFSPDTVKALAEKFTVAEGLPDNSVYGVSIGKNGINSHVWAATFGYGILKYDGKKFSTFTENEGLLDNFVHCILVDNRGIVWCGSNAGISRFDGVKFLNMSLESLGIEEKGIYTILEDGKGTLWFGAHGGLISYPGDGQVTSYDEAEGLNSKEVNCLTEDDKGNIWIGTNSGGIYRLDVSSKEKQKIKFVAGDSLLGTNSIKSLLFLSKTELLAGTTKGLCRISFDKNGVISGVRNYDAGDGFIGVECNDNAIFKDSKENVWIGTVKCLTRFNEKEEIKDTEPPRVHITGLKLFFKEVDWSLRSDSVNGWFNLPANLVLSSSENHLTFSYAGISLTNPRQVRYKYMLEGASSEWSPERSETEITFSGLSPGKYKFKVISRGANGIWNTEPAVYYFVISPPWYLTKWFFIGCAVFLIFGVWSFVKVREKKLLHEKKVLEDKVTARTAEIVKQKEHIEEQKREITDSINYAKRIQGAVLAPLSDIAEALPLSFVLFKPKDIVSGDFYWFHASDTEIMIAAADCTGHGVPGGFMSMLGMEKLNEAVMATAHPGQLLQRLNKLIKKVLRQSGQQDATRDGMDIALCVIDKKMKTLTYAGANRPLWIIRSGSTEIEEIKATKTAIGGFTEDNQEFAEHSIGLNKGDLVYMFSDGYADQFGVGNKKFMTKRFKELLLSIAGKPMEEQKRLLDKQIESWKGAMEQTDDILVIGIGV